MGRQKMIHFSSNKQGQEFINAMAVNAEYNELVIQHPASGEGETALWTLENVDGQKTPVMFPNKETIQVMIDESTESERQRAISAETMLRESIDSIVVVKVDDSQLESNEKEAYEIQVDGVTKGERIRIYKDSSLYKVYIGHIDDTIVSDEDPTVINGTGDTALCLIYYTVAGTYQLVTIDIEHFIEENEFKDGLQVVNHQVSVLINPNSDEYLTVDANGILLSGVSSKFDELDEKIELESLRALSAETILAEAIDSEAERAKDAETVLHDDIKAETERAVSAETSLQIQIENENERAFAAEQALDDKIDIESDRAKDAETVLDNKIEEESERASEVEQQLEEELDAEVERAMSAETALNNEIESESERALAAEQTLDAKIDSEVIRAQSAETVLNETIVAENNRALVAEQALDAKLDVEVERAMSAETTLNNEIESESERALSAEQALDSKVDTEKVRAQSAETVLNEELEAESVRAQDAEEALDNKIESIELVRLPDSGYSSNERDVYELQIDGVKHGDKVVVYKDSSLKSVYLGHVDDRLVSEDSTDIISGTGDTALCFIYFTVDGIYQLIPVDVEDFLQESEFINGLQVNNHIVSVKIDESSEEYLTVSEDGIKLSGIQNAVLEMAQEVEGKCATSAQTLSDAINAETERAMSAETVLNEQIVAENNRALAAEQALDTKVDAESERAQSAETSLHEEVVSESERALAAEVIVDAKVDAESERALAVEQTLDGKINEEISERTNANSSLLQQIETEVQRAQSAETILEEMANNEEVRATSAETVLQQQIDAINVLLSDIKTQLNQLSEKIENESARALANEIILENSVQELSASTINV